ncbi:unnamed protein product [Hermetia illucens]|uniref:Uncharacterized protein n=1 Tax=Hermetia illucens TaxID=343691 RepID=A0A7R8UDE1_HERIL|nr:unnamed protein product [Hermetia illucens]
MVQASRELLTASGWSSTASVKKSSVDMLLVLVLHTRKEENEAQELWRCYNVRSVLYLLRSNCSQIRDLDGFETTLLRPRDLRAAARQRFATCGENVAVANMKKKSGAVSGVVRRKVTNL